MRAQEKAVGRAATTATVKLNRSPKYPPDSTLSNEFPSGGFCRAASTVPQPADTRAAVGALVLYLVGRPLPKSEREFGWVLAQRWLGELVVARRKVEVA